LRYGLPADFTAVLLEPNLKSDKKLRTALDALYKGIGSGFNSDDKDDDEEGTATNEKFYSYVWTSIGVVFASSV